MELSPGPTGSYDSNLSSSSFNPSFRPPLQIDNPSAFFQRLEDSQHVIELVHAGTLLSGDVIKNGEISEEIRDYFKQSAGAGITTLYVVGMYETGDFSKLIMPFFSREWSKPSPAHHVGASVFSVLDYTPHHKLSSWSATEKLIAAAGEEGVTLVFDFIPNTIAVDSVIAMRQPHFIRNYNYPDLGYDQLTHSVDHLRSSGGRIYHATSNHSLSGKPATQEVEVFKVGHEREIMLFTRTFADEKFSVYLQRSRSGGFKPYGYIDHEQSDGSQHVYCKQLGTDGFVNWADVFMLETNSPDVICWQAEVLARLSMLVPAIRADMAHLPKADYWSELQDEVASQGVQVAEIWGEAYGAEAHANLAARNVHSYANYLREWLTDSEMHISPLLRQLYVESGGREFYKKGMSIAYTANHDDAMGTFLPEEAAATAILTSLPVTKIMLAQGQRHGDTRRYGADQHVPMDDFYDSVKQARMRDPGYADFMDRLIPLMGARVFRSPKSDFTPVVFDQVQNRNHERLFHIVRTLDDERIMTVVQAEQANPDSRIIVNVSKSFNVPESDLSDYRLLNVLNGEVLPATASLEIRSNPALAGFDVHMFALIPLNKLTG